MHHLTLNTAHTRVSPRSEVGDEVIKLLSPMTHTGNHIMPKLKGYTVKTTAVGTNLLATLYRNQYPVLTLGVAAKEEDADQLWKALTDHYEEMLVTLKLPKPKPYLPPKPDSTPWCAVGLFLITAAEQDWLGDFERCLAHAFLERIRKESN